MQRRPTGPTGTAMAKPMAMPFNRVSIKSTATRSRSAPLPAEKGIATEAPHDNAGVCPPVQLALPGGFRRPARRTIPWSAHFLVGRQTAEEAFGRADDGERAGPHCGDLRADKAAADPRSEARRVGKECVSTCRSR